MFSPLIFGVDLNIGVSTRQSLITITYASQLPLLPSPVLLSISFN
jgi:hypothetical protein